MQCGFGGRLPRRDGSEFWLNQAWAVNRRDFAPVPSVLGGWESRRLVFWLRVFLRRCCNFSVHGICRQFLL